eukprot:Lankesteria_metandrocarpae@DN8720_c0_g1_i1.p2
MSMKTAVAANTLSQVLEPSALHSTPHPVSNDSVPFASTRLSSVGIPPTRPSFGAGRGRGVGSLANVSHLGLSSSSAVRTNLLARVGLMDSSNTSAVVVKSQAGTVGLHPSRIKGETSGGEVRVGVVKRERTTEYSVKQQQQLLSSTYENGAKTERSSHTPTASLDVEVVADSNDSGRLTPQPISSSSSSG